MLYSLRKKAYQKFSKKSKKYSRKNLYDRLRIELRGIQNGTNVLNVGAGGDVARVITEELKGKSIDMKSMDIDPEMNPDIVGDVCNIPFPDQSLDLLIIMEVLEHVKEPFIAISEVYRVLKPNAKVILSTPFIYPVHADPHDYFRYTKNGLLYMLRSFKNVEVVERNNYVEAIDVLLIRSISDRDEMTKLFSLITYYSGLRLVIKLLGLGIKSKNLTTGYIAVAQK